jgi:hypothetical protein
MTKSVRMIFGYNWAIIYSEVFLLENVFLWPKSLNDFLVSYTILKINL